MRAAWQFAGAGAPHGRIAAIVIVLVLSLVAGACVADAPASLASPIPPARYQVISDIATMESDIEQLKRDVAGLRDQVGVLQLLRAHDIQMHQRVRAEDQKRIVALEVTVNRQLWPAQCR